MQRYDNLYEILLDFTTLERNDFKVHRRFYYIVLHLLCPF